MAYKTDLQSNNTDLQSILDMILALGLVDAPPPLINFTIAGTTYQAEEGMTWAEWCESEYNTSGYHVDGVSVFTQANGSYIYGAPSSDEIVSGTAYTLTLNTSGGGGD